MCPVFVQLCPSHQLGDLHCVRAAGRAACEVKYKLGHHFSVTQFGSPTAQILLESGSSADKRFRTDLNIFNKNCIIYVSRADVQSERRWVQLRRSKRSRVELASFLFLLLRHKSVQPIRSLLPYPALETSRASESVLMGLEHSRSPRAKTSIKIKSTTKPRA